MKLPFPSRYFITSVLLLSALVALVVVSGARRIQRELSSQLEEKGLALAEALETSSRNAILSNALMEEMVTQRLLDNARLVDQLLRLHPPSPEWLEQLAAANGLARIDVLDRDGRPYAPPAQPPGMMGRMISPVPRPDRDFGEHRAMMMYMWGRRWAPPSNDESAPPTIRDQKFWKGNVAGVAVGARSFPGIIAVHADAKYVLNFAKEIGVQRQIEELGHQAGIESIALLDQDLTVVAHSNPERVGQRETDGALRAALESRRGSTGLVSRDGKAQIFEIVRPLALEGDRKGLVRIDLSTASMGRVWRSQLFAAMVLGLAVLGLGILGLAAIFYTQHRHLAEVKVLEAEVERRDRLSTLGNMAAAVAHEIRNPLNAISMGLQRLRVEFAPAEADEYRRLLEVAQGEVRRLNTIVEEFLSLGRPLSLKPEPIQVTALLDEVVGLVEHEAQSAGIRIERQVSGDLPALHADRDRMNQVLLNLALNGIQAMPDGGALILGAAAADGTMTLTVEDTGPGISPDLLPRVFEPYVTTKTKGLGLGLTIARRIVEAHGGHIDVENKPDRGTRFRVMLPVDGTNHG
jgi:two-component system sensor histidine kinase HydH